VESTRLPHQATLGGRVQTGLIFTLLLLAAIAWAITDDRMRGMDAGPATDPGALGFWLTAWVVMMAAMMFPSIAPMVMTYVRVQDGKRERGDAILVGTTTLFVAGYLLTWSTAGMVAYAVIEAGRALDVAFLAWNSAGPYVAGGVIVAAAVYQLTPLKDACLRRCRSPLSFLIHAWRPGRAGAIRMGVEHGAWCVGCCWALMAALIALGVMSIGWMVFVAALIAVEKLSPWKAIANRGIAVLLVVLGLAVAFAPQDVPGLTTPDSPAAIDAMEAMEGMAPGGGAGTTTDKVVGGHESIGGAEGANDGADESMGGAGMPGQ
jgi:predicted metal-binding membrane protein